MMKAAVSASASASANPAEFFRLDVTGGELECACWPGSGGSSPQAPLLLLHEGLGSVSMWGRFPARLAAASGRTVLAYSRPGYGRSTPHAAPRQADYLHREAWQVLPEVIAAMRDARRIETTPPILVGHSDGASIALLFAARHGDQASGVVVMAPHLWVEAESLAGIRLAGERWRNSDFRSRLARHHADPVRVFDDWHDTWLGESFADWNIESEVAKISLPVLAIQGMQDEYGTLRQIERISELASAATVSLRPLDHCGHSPQNDQASAVIDAITRFAAAQSVPPPSSTGGAG